MSLTDDTTALIAAFEAKYAILPNTIYAGRKQFANMKRVTKWKKQKGDVHGSKGKLMPEFLELAVIEVNEINHLNVSFIEP